MEVIIGHAFAPNWLAAAINYENLVPAGIPVWLDLHYHQGNEPVGEPNAVRIAQAEATRLARCLLELNQDVQPPARILPVESNPQVYQKPGQGVVRIQYTKWSQEPLGVMDQVLTICVASSEEHLNLVKFVVAGKIVPFWQFPLPAWSLLLGVGVGVVGAQYLWRRTR